MAAGIEEMGVDGRSDDGRSPADSKPRDRSRRGLALPVALALGWGVLLGYSTVLLTNDTPVRPDAATAQAAMSEPSPFENPQGSSAPTRAVAPWSDVAPSPPLAASLKDAGDGSYVPPGTRAVALRHDLEALPHGEAPAAASPPIEPAAYVGLWGPTETACRRGARRRGFLPARITEGGAKAGNTVCTFRDGRRNGTGWSVAASCSDGGRRWSSQVKLVVDGDRLTWSSARGDASYIRCGRRAG